MASAQFNMWQQMPKGLKVAVWIVLGILFFVVMAFVLGWVIQLLWNATIADMFGGPTISYWQAIGVFILAKILFGFGVGGSNSSGSKSRKKKEAEAVSAEPETMPDLAVDETFRKFWQEEGREAYEAFRTKGPGTETQ